MKINMRKKNKRKSTRNYHTWLLKHYNTDYNKFRHSQKGKHARTNNEHQHQPNHNPSPAKSTKKSKLI